MAHFNTGKKRSAATRLKLRLANLGKKHTPESLEKLSKSLRKFYKTHKKKGMSGKLNPMYGKPISDEHREHLRTSHTGKKQSRKTIEKRRKTLIAKYKKTPMPKHSAERIENNRLAHLGKKHPHTVKWNRAISKAKMGHSVSDAARLKISQAQIGRKRSVESVDKQRRSLSLFFATTKNTFAKLYKAKGIRHKVRSTLEESFARILIDNKIGYAYEPGKFELTNDQNISRWYWPDFKINNTDIYVECKGYHKRNDWKMVEFRKQYPQFKFYLVTYRKYLQERFDASMFDEIFCIEDLTPFLNKIKKAS